MMAAAPDLRTADKAQGTFDVVRKWKPSGHTAEEETGNMKWVMHD